MAFRGCLRLDDHVRKLQSVLIKDWPSGPFWMTQCRFASVRPRPSDDTKLQRHIRPPIQVTADGILKRPGWLISKYKTLDGKPIFPGKDKNWRLSEGTVVRTGMMLCLQRKLHFHPGLFVGLGRGLTLFAYEDGVIHITWEKVNVNWDNWIAKEFYIDEQDNDIYMPHYHVIPTPQLSNFKLVSQT